jgi:ABC-2 type transport system permease protein
MHSLRLVWLFLRISALNELQYRVNFFLQLLQSLIALGTGLVGLSIVFQYTDSLRGWTHSELLAVLGVYTLTGGVIRTLIQPNMERLMEDIRAGTLDYALTKPADAQLLVSVREVRIWQATEVLLGLIILAVAVVRLQRGLSVWELLGFLVALALGGLMIYAFWLIITTGAFWLVRMHNVLELFGGMYRAGQWPVGVYPNWLRVGLTFLVPVAFAVTVPAEALTGRLALETLLGAAGLCALLLIIARLWWRVGVRSYSGASA